MSEIEYVEVPCPSCEGDFEKFSKVPYFKTVNEVGYVHCKWCMDAGVVRERKKNV